MKLSGVPILLALASAAAFADAELVVSADEALVSVKPNDSQLTRLPSLEFSVHAEFECEDGAVAQSLLIGVADAHERHVPEPEAKSFHAIVTVPRNQIASVTTGDFCAGEDAGDELLLSGVATAQFTLRCGDESSASVSYASLGLPLRLVCDQESSEELSAAPR